jgi:archaellum component FlaC
MNWGSLTNEELIRYADRAPAALLAERLTESIDTEWTEERCEQEWEKGAAHGAKESTDANREFLEGLSDDIEGVLDSLDGDYDVTAAAKQLRCIINRIETKL